MRRAGRPAALLCTLLLCLSVFPLQARAEEQDVPVVRVGYYENEVFQEGAGEGEVKNGYAYEYYRKLSEYTGWKYEYVYGDFADLYQMLLDGEVDLLAGLAWRADREELMGYPDLAMGYESYIFVRHDSDGDITTDPSTLNGRRIGVLESAMVQVAEQYLASHAIDADLVSYPSYDALLADFDAGALDILVAEGDGAYWRDHASVLFAFGASDYYLCVNRNRPDILSELNEAQALLEVEEPNYINYLRTKYYPVSVSARAFSEAEKAWIGSHDTLHVGYMRNYLPYSDTDADGSATGIVTDMVPEILKGLGISGIEVTYEGFEGYDQLIEAVNSGEIDVAFPVGGGLYYSEENGIYQSNAVVSASTELVYKGEYSEETVRHFAVNQSNNMQYYYVRTHFPDAEITLYPSIDGCLMAVLSGEAGCTTLNGLRANDILKNSRYDGLLLRQLSQSDDRSFGIRIGNEGLLKLINRGINVVGDDYAQNQAYRYVGGLYAYSFGDLIMDHIGAFAALFLAVAALIIFLLLRDSRRARAQSRDREEARAALEEKNAELARSKDALSDALIAAEQANRAKTTFLNNMSHDIRTPMNAIVGFTALAASHLDDREQVKDYLDKISVSSQHLLSLINDVLDMSRIESGKMAIEETDVHLPDVIRDLRTIVQANVAAKQQTLTVDTGEMIHEDIVTDKLRLNQVLLNILSNAIKFTPEGGTIDFRVIEKPVDRPGWTGYEFRIRDNGIGMSEEFRKTIFNAFTREKTSTVSGIQGTGLGMAITKNIVDMMNGTIVVRSEEGKGSEFTVNIPCRISTPHAEEVTEERPDVDFHGKRILLAEDNAMNQMIAVAILEAEGFEVEIAGDGGEAVEMMRSAPAGHYDVVLMDIQMPRVDGYEAARQIRALEDPDKAGIPIIAVTANAFEEDRQIALEAGMNGHLAKPYDVEKMMKTLAEILQ